MKKTNLDSMFDEAMAFINKYAVENPTEYPPYLLHKAGDGTMYSIDGRHPHFGRMSDSHLTKTIAYYKRHGQTNNLSKYTNELTRRALISDIEFNHFEIDKNQHNMNNNTN